MRPFQTFYRISLLAAAFVGAGSSQASEITFPVQTPPTNKYMAIDGDQIFHTVHYSNKVKLKVTSGEVFAVTNREIIVARRPITVEIQPQPTSGWSADKDTWTETRDFRHQHTDQGQSNDPVGYLGTNYDLVTFKNDDNQDPPDEEPIYQIEKITPYVRVADLQVDSLNQNPYGGVSNSDQEDDKEDTNEGGKILGCNTISYSSGSGKPGWADFSAAPASQPPFATMHLFLQSFPNDTEVRFKYSGSNPSQITQDSEGNWLLPAQGCFRVWTKNVYDARSLNEYVQPNTAYSFDQLANMHAKVADGHFVFYVEAVKAGASLADNQVTVEVKTPGSSWVTLDTVRFVAAELFRDRNGDKPNRVKLDDWPEMNGKVRSPRHLLAKEDNIYIRLLGLSGSAYKVKVTSESDSSGVVLDLSEIDGGLENQGANRLRLADSSGSSGGAKTLKVIDEEVLSFSLVVNGQSPRVFAEVMVDRAEFASGGIDGFYSGGSGDRSVVRDKMLTDYKFFENGDLQLPGNSTSNPAATSAFLQNAGSNDPKSKQADIIHFSSHGNAAGKLFDHSPNANMLFDPASDVTAGTTWNEDVEWVVLASCSQLNETGGGRAAWENAIKGSNRPAHGILGAYEPLSAALQSVYESFWSYLNDEQIGPYVTIPQAYSLAMEAGGQPWAMVYHTANEVDMLREYKRDETGATTFTYLTGISGFNFTCGRDLEEYKSDKDLPLDDGIGVARFKIDEMAKRARSARSWVKMRSVSASETNLSKAIGFVEIGSGRAVAVQKALLNKPSLLNPDDATELADRTVEQAFQVDGVEIREIRVAERRRIDTRGDKVDESLTGFLVQYGFYVDEIPVWDAYINVSIFQNEVASIGYKVVEMEGPSASGAERPVENIKTALYRAIPEIKRDAGIKGKYSIDMAELCYVSKGKFGGSADEYVPTWHAVLNLAPNEKVCAKRHAWIDAYTGKLLGIER